MTNESEAMEVAERIEDVAFYEPGEIIPAVFDVEAAARVIATALEARDARIRELEGACRDALEIITDSWGEDQIERGDDQACNILRTTLTKQEPKS